MNTCESSDSDLSCITVGSSRNSYQQPFATVAPRHQKMPVGDARDPYHDRQLCLSLRQQQKRHVQQHAWRFREHRASRRRRSSFRASYISGFDPTAARWGQPAKHPSVEPELARMEAATATAPSKVWGRAMLNRSYSIATQSDETQLLDRNVMSVSSLAQSFAT